MLKWIVPPARPLARVACTCRTISSASHAVFVIAAAGSCRTRDV